jgi:hypothetical protein
MRSASTADSTSALPVITSVTVLGSTSSAWRASERPSISAICLSTIRRCGDPPASIADFASTGSAYAVTGYPRRSRQRDSAASIAGSSSTTVIGESAALGRLDSKTGSGHGVGGAAPDPARAAQGG